METLGTNGDLNEKNESSNEYEDWPLERLTSRYIELRIQNKKIHLCNYYFRQKCLKSSENCQFAHGVSDLNRIPSPELKAIKKQLFGIKRQLQAMKYAVLFNWVSKQYEVYTHD